MNSLILHHAYSKHFYVVDYDKIKCDSNRFSFMIEHHKLPFIFIMSSSMLNNVNMINVKIQPLKLDNSYNVNEIIENIKNHVFKKNDIVVECIMYINYLMITIGKHFSQDANVHTEVEFNYDYDTESKNEILVIYKLFMMYMHPHSNIIEGNYHHQLWKIYFTSLRTTEVDHALLDVFSNSTTIINSYEDKCRKQMCMKKMFKFLHNGIISKELNAHCFKSFVDLFCTTYNALYYLQVNFLSSIENMIDWYIDPNKEKYDEYYILHHAIGSLTKIYNRNGYFSIDLLSKLNNNNNGSNTINKFRRLLYISLTHKYPLDDSVTNMNCKLESVHTYDYVIENKDVKIIENEALMFEKVYNQNVTSHAYIYLHEVNKLKALIKYIAMFMKTNDYNNIKHTILKNIENPHNDRFYLMCNVIDDFIANNDITIKINVYNYTRKELCEKLISSIVNLNATVSKNSIEMLNIMNIVGRLRKKT